MFCVVCGSESGKAKHCSSNCRVRSHRLERAGVEFGFLYIIDFGDILKIGFSKNPNVRVSAICSASGRVNPKMTVYGPFREPEEVECAMHDSVKEFNIIGEWFDVGAKQQVIDALGAFDVFYGSDMDVAAEVSELLEKVKEFKGEMPYMKSCSRVSDTVAAVEAFSSTKCATVVGGCVSLICKHILMLSDRVCDNLEELYRNDKGAFIGLIDIICRASSLKSDGFAEADLLVCQKTIQPEWFFVFKEAKPVYGDMSIFI